MIESTMMDLILNEISKLENKMNIELKRQADVCGLDYVHLSSEIAYSGQAFGNSVSKDNMSVIVKFWFEPFQSVMLLFHISSIELDDGSDFVSLVTKLLVLIQESGQDFDKNKLIDLFNSEKDKFLLSNLELVSSEIEL